MFNFPSLRRINCLNILQSLLSNVLVMYCDPASLKELALFRKFSYFIVHNVKGKKSRDQDHV